MPVPETPAQSSLRTLAAPLALIAGAVHLGQVGVHFAEGWPIAGFFIVVGVIQVGAAVLLLRPRARQWFWFGIVGSAAVIAVWVVSRTLGLPFVEGGEAEQVGVADGVASLTEAWTIVVLGIYLAEPAARWRLAAFGIGTALTVGLAGLWSVAAGHAVFNADLARLAVAQPWLVDWLVASAGAVLAAALLLGIWAPPPVAWYRGLLRGLAGATAMTGAALVWLTLPPFPVYARDPLGFVTRVSADYGGVVPFRLGPFPAILVVGAWPRAGAGHLLHSRGKSASEISLPRPGRSREWLNVALIECCRCHQVVERRSPVQRYCQQGADHLRRIRSRTTIAPEDAGGHGGLGAVSKRGASTRARCCHRPVRDQAPPWLPSTGERDA